MHTSLGNRLSWYIQLTVSHTNTSSFHMFFLNFTCMCHFCFSWKTPSYEKEIDLVLVYCNSAALIFTLPLFQKLVIGLFKIYSTALSELVWFTIDGVIRVILEAFMLKSKTTERLFINGIRPNRDFSLEWNFSRMMCFTL